MKQEFEVIKKPRLMLLNVVKDLSPEQLNHIPAGFNNNLIWNLAHMISGQQGICYTRAGVPIVVDDKYYTPYRPETKPQSFINADDIAEVKELLISTIDKMEEDYQTRIFSNYQPMTTRYGVTLSNIEEAIRFLPFHDGLHTGYIMALKRAVLEEMSKLV
ncbi:DinB family protein [Mucilaginibacter rubeus]|uniref:DinB family protein n=1 Tax=Mucilaginibacter rubeus TaxID=2027860 RepID=A0AAE6MJK7_9SPHI|nr:MULTISPECIES: DinB family protein [Mucilaginibacter]QEM05840.1 DinB family protein [Mucilaginibacter rubeus]QEM18422.1 DinB family protein [Mucilaginibacter gossypii]QTE45040.1 DinB family protein [Mucilaginibacter rubeus]QTE51637.1 DinB family protein [Mucilaginibacter rubeus]QTE56723.1 DinB family protein [Mucilaginibacter rubeus]